MTPSNIEMASSDVQLILLHFPAIGVHSLVKVHRTDDARVLEVERSLWPGYAAYWRVRFNGSGVSDVERAVAGLIEAGKSVASCPRTAGRDGIVWAMMTPPDRRHYALEFEHSGGGVACDDFERFANRLMQLAHLKCTRDACFRPKEEASRKFECISGPRGNPCREEQGLEESSGP